MEKVLRGQLSTGMMASTCPPNKMNKGKRLWKGCFGFSRTQEKGDKGNTHSLWK